MITTNEAKRNCTAENAEWAKKLADTYVKQGATVMINALPAYSLFAEKYKHANVNHSIEFSTDEGVNNNTMR